MGPSLEKWGFVYRKASLLPYSSNPYVNLGEKSTSLFSVFNFSCLRDVFIAIYRTQLQMQNLITPYNILIVLKTEPCIIAKHAKQPRLRPQY